MFRTTVSSVTRNSSEAVMKNALCAAVVVVVGLAVWGPDLAAWGDDGHQIVGRIAARKLTPKTKRRIVAILRTGGDDQLHLPALLGATGDPQPSLTVLAEAFGRMATWPDHMPGGKGNTGPWHYVDFGLFEGPNTTADRCADGCVTRLIETLKSNIPAGKSVSVVEADGKKRTFPVDKELRFLIHFFGDIHQTLHASTNADGGGNCVKATGFGSDDNLHHAWDTDLVGVVRGSATLDAMALALLHEFGGDVLAGGVVDPRQIAGESFALAKDDIYPKSRPKAVGVIDHFVAVKPPQECAAKAPAEIRNASVDVRASFANPAAEKLVREQLFKAGVRLATVLNELFQ